MVNDGGGAYKIFDTKNKLVKNVDTDVKAEANNLVSSTGNLDLYHFQNFVDAIRGNTKINSPVNEVSKSVLLCHLANIAQRTGKILHCDSSNAHILNDADAMKLWQREYEKGWEPEV